MIASHMSKLSKLFQGEQFNKHKDEKRQGEIDFDHIDEVLKCEYMCRNLNAVYESEGMADVWGEGSALILFGLTCSDFQYVQLLCSIE